MAIEANVLAGLSNSLVGVATALGCGLLIGIERERRKGEGPNRAFAGVRTFAIASLCGALATLVDSSAIAAAALLAVAALAAVSHWLNSSNDPGITTEVALIATFLVGMLSMSKPALAAGVAIVVVALLFMRVSMQQFAVSVLSERELSDAIVLLSLALILLPLVPDHTIHDYFPINPYRVLRLVVAMSAIQATGHVMLRLFGSRVGVPLAGLMSGFVSSTATHAAMGARARANVANTSAYVSAAILSNVATAIQAVLVVTAISPLRVSLWLPYLATMGITAAVCGTIAFRRIRETESTQNSKAFSLWQACVFATLLTAVMALSTLAQKTWGEPALWLTAAFAAIVDVHVAIASLASQSASDEHASALALLVCLSINAIVKIVATFVAAGRSRFSIEVTLSMMVIALAPWLLWSFR